MVSARKSRTDSELQAPEQLIEMPESARNQGPDTSSSDETERFRKALRDSLQYPRNLPVAYVKERPKLVYDFRRHFDNLKDSILLIIPPDVAEFRRRAIEKRIRVQFHDCGLHDDARTRARSPRAKELHQPPPLQRSESTQSVWDDADDSQFKELFNNKDLNSVFGIKLGDEYEVDGKVARKYLLSLEPRVDPVCRFMYEPQ